MADPWKDASCGGKAWLVPATVSACALLGILLFSGSANRTGKIFSLFFTTRTAAYWHSWYTEHTYTRTSTWRRSYLRYSHCYLQFTFSLVCDLGTIGSDKRALKGVRTVWPNVFPPASARFDSRKHQSNEQITFLFSARLKSILKIYHWCKWCPE